MPDKISLSGKLFLSEDFDLPDKEADLPDKEAGPVESTIADKRRVSSGFVGLSDCATPTAATPSRLPLATTGET